MSEKLILTPENNHEAPNVRVERPKHSAEQASAEKDRQDEQLVKAQEAVAAESAATEQAVVPQLPVTDDRPQFIDKTIKALRMRQSLKQVQSKLKPAEKSFSKVIHQPLVQKVSESASKTVTRPSGIMGGGLVAFVGSLGYLWLTYHYGLEYNYGFFLVFFVSGFILGLAGEYATYLVRKARR